MKKLLYGQVILLIALFLGNCKTITTLTVESNKSSSKEVYNPDEIIVIVELKINNDPILKKKVEFIKKNILKIDKNFKF